MDVNSLPKTVTRQRRGCDLNPDPAAPESSTPTNRLPSHPRRDTETAERVTRVATGRISYCCAPVTDDVGRQRLRSATQQLMVVPRHRLSTVGRRAFAVHGPMVWNCLPDDLRAQQDYESPRQGLKPGFSPDTSVFSALETFVIIAPYINRHLPYHAIQYHIVTSPRSVYMSSPEGVIKLSGVGVS